MRISFSNIILHVINIRIRKNFSRKYERRMIMINIIWYNIIMRYNNRMIIKSGRVRVLRHVVL